MAGVATQQELGPCLIADTERCCITNQMNLVRGRPMKRPILFGLLGVASTISVAAATPLPPHSKAATRPIKLEGMSYTHARPIILKFGWKPLRGNCGGGGATDTICKEYPEVGNCSGTGMAFCDMTFVRRARCLTVITAGGPPDTDEHEHAVVRDVLFGPGPCSKDPNEGKL